MRQTWILVLGAALLLGTSAQAGTTDNESADLLARMTTGKAVAQAPLTVAELSEIRGEGTIERFISIPNLRRDWSKTVSADGLTITINQVAGSGITISISGDQIPSHP